MLRLALSGVVFVSMLFWIRAAWLAQKAMKLHLARQGQLSADGEVVSILIKRLDPEALADRVTEKVIAGFSDGLADRVTEKVTARMRAEEKLRNRAMVKKLEELNEQIRTIAPTVRATQSNKGSAIVRTAKR